MTWPNKSYLVFSTLTAIFLYLSSITVVSIMDDVNVMSIAVMGSTVTQAPSRQSPSVERYPPDLDSLYQSHMFGYLGESEPHQEQRNIPETRLNLTLRGIFASDNPEQSVVLIDNESDAPGLHKEQALIGQGVILQHIARDHVVINRNGLLERLSLGAPQQTERTRPLPGNREL